MNKFHWPLGGAGAGWEWCASLLGLQARLTYLFLHGECLFCRYVKSVYHLQLDELLHVLGSEMPQTSMPKVSNSVGGDHTTKVSRCSATPSNTQSRPCDTPLHGLQARGVAVTHQKSILSPKEPKTRHPDRACECNCVNSTRTSSRFAFQLVEYACVQPDALRAATPC